MEDFVEYLKKHADDAVDLTCEDIRLAKYNRRNGLYNVYVNTGFYKLKQRQFISKCDYDDETDYIFYYGKQNTGYSLKFHASLAAFVPIVSNFTKAGYYKIMRGKTYTGYDLRYEKNGLFLYYNGGRYYRQSIDYADNNSFSYSESESALSSQAESPVSSTKNSAPKKGISLGTIIFIVIAIVVFLKFCGS